MNIKSCLLIFFFISLNEMVASKNLSVLLMVPAFPSHQYQAAALGGELVRRGHRVTAIGATTEGYEHNIDRIKSEGIEYINCATMDKDFYLGYVNLMKFNPSTFYDYLNLSYSNYKYFANAEGSTSENFLITMRKKIDTLNGSQYDYLIADIEALPLLYYASARWNNRQMMLILPFLGGIPRYTVPWPFPKLFSPFSDNMTFLDRLMNTVVFGPIEIMLAIPYTWFLSPEKVLYDVSYKINPFTNLISQPTLYTTVIGLEYPHTLLPMQHYVGPLLPSIPPPINPPLAEWLESDPNRPLIYISMGTTIVLTKEEFIILSQLSKDYRIVWSVVYSDDFMGEVSIDRTSIYISNWVPQLAILQYPGLELAILHCGTNGVQEALYNAVPVVCISHSLDHHDVAFRLEMKKLGVSIPSKDLTAESLQAAISKVLNSSEIKDNVRKLSKLYRAAGGVNKAADLVELYADVGYNHTIPSFLRYGWSSIEYYNIDVWLVVAGLLCVYLWVVWKLLCKCISCLCCCTKKEKQD
jgi:glucuronosyltransferase